VKTATCANCGRSIVWEGPISEWVHGFSHSENRIGGAAIEMARRCYAGHFEKATPIPEPEPERPAWAGGYPGFVGGGTEYADFATHVGGIGFPTSHSDEVGGSIADNARREGLDRMRKEGWL
jgi:hypothetical protein